MSGRTGGDGARGGHRRRVLAAARRVMAAHADALDRLGRAATGAAG